MFSFEVNRTVEMPFTTADTFRTARTFRTDRTASYQATGDLSLRWTGLPGWLDQTYFLMFLCCFLSISWVNMMSTCCLNSLRLVEMAVKPLLICCQRVGVRRAD